jgi:RNA polymerase sigma factor (sigma-70 family)
MTANRTANFFARLRPASAESDADLVRRYAATRDGAAFEALVRRHGPLVLAACRRVVGHAQDAEDAFQAVFLVLARGAGTIREPHLLASWLYGVAVRVARKARRRTPRRREVSEANMPEPTTPPPADGADLWPVIDAELAALPAWYRQAILLCDVQQLPRAAAATQLGIPEGTLSSRLAKGRKLLARRLARRGVVLTLPALASIATAAVPDVLIQKTLETAAAWAAGGLVADPILHLSREGLTMIRKLLLLGGGVLAATALGVGLASDPAKPPTAAGGNPPAKPAAVVADAKPEAKLGPPRPRGIAPVAGELQAIHWAADGKQVVLSAVGQHPRNDFGTTHSWVQLFKLNDTGLQPVAPPPTNTSLEYVQGEVIGLHPTEPRGVVLQLREVGGINVQNKLIVRRLYLQQDEKSAIVHQGELTDDSDLVTTLTADGRAVLSVIYDTDLDKAELREIDYTTGRVSRVVFRTDEEILAWSADGTAAVTAARVQKKVRFAALGNEEVIQSYVQEVHVWDCKSNRKRFAWKPPVEDLPGLDVVVSRDAKTVAFGLDQVVYVFDAISGRELKKYPVTEKRKLTEHHLSHDGRLTVVREVNAPQPPTAPGGDGSFGGPPGKVMPAVQSSPRAYVIVYDNATGKPVKRWETDHHLTLAFAPDRPTLAVLERPQAVRGGPGGGMAGGIPGAGMMGAGGGAAPTGRLGIWDFGR